MGRGWLALFGVVTVLFSSCGRGTGASGAAAQTAKRAIAVILNGQGSVRSSPDGINCGQTCQASFDASQPVRLIATADEGYRFDGWGGGCTGTDPCQLTLSRDVQVLANFVPDTRSPAPTDPPQPPPPPPPGSVGPPPAECAGLLPQNPIGDGIQVALPTNVCYPRGTSDDIDGNFALVHGVEMPNGGSFPAARFFTIRDGQAIEVGAKPDGGDMGYFKVWSQPSGFTIFSTNETSASRSLATYSHDGALLRVEPITRLETHSLDSSASSAIDPSGGTAIVRRYPISNATRSTYQRYDKDGAPGGPEVDIGTRSSVFRLGVSVTGNVLVIVGDAGASLSARWLKRDGTPLTDWFSAPSASAAQLPRGDDGPAEAFGSELTFLADGSLLMSDRNGTHFVYPDGQARIEAAPPWLRDRPLATVYLIRGGRGYGVARSGQCGGGFEILTASGTSCGCLDGPDLTQADGAPTPNSFVGRDGSLIVQRHDGPKCGLGYRLYPGLLR